MSLGFEWAEDRASFVLLRHAETASNERGIWHGAIDEAISPAARKATEIASLRLGDVSDPVCMRLVSSDLRRAVDTAEIVRAALRLNPIVLEPLLRERDMGQWAGKSPIDIERTCPGALAAWEQGTLAGPPGGETDQEVAARGLASLRRHAVSGDTQTVVITHAGIIRSVNRILTGCQPLVPHLGGYWLLLNSDGSFSMGRQVALGDPNVKPRT